jgi:hypothetical protein
VNFKTILNTSVAATALMAIAAPAFAQDTFTSVDRMRTGAKLVIYGHVNKAVLWGDDGNNDRLFIVDNNATSATRFGFIATTPLSADVTIEGHLEFDAVSNGAAPRSAPQADASVGVQINTGAAGGRDANDNNVATDKTLIERIMEVSITSKSLGKVSLGQGSTATDGTAEYYQGGAVNVVGVLSHGFLNSTVLYDKTNTRYDSTSRAKGAAAAVATLGSGISTFDGARDDRVRYDTPRIMGFRASASFASGGEGAGAFDYNHKIGAFNVVGGAGYSNISGRSGTVAEQYMGSVSVLHESGLNASFNAGHRVYKKDWTQTATGAITNNAGTEYHDTGKANVFGGTVGYIAKIFAIGPTAFGVDYASYNGVKVQGSEVITYGIGVEQTFAKSGSSLYLGYRTFETDRGAREKANQGSGTATIGNVDDVNIVVAGMRVLF